MQIISRAQWGARYADGYGSSTLPAAEVWLHHSVTTAPDLVPPFDDDDAAVRLLERIGQQRFGRGISYTFAVTPVGRVYEGHSVEREGAHTAGRNDRARAIVLVGDYTHERVTDAQIESVAELLVHGWRSGWWQRPRLNGGHRDVPGASTACPGAMAAAAVRIINARAAALSQLPTEGDTVPDLTDSDVQRIAEAVWGRHMGATRGGGVELPDMTAGARLDALHRLAVLGKLRDAELRTSLAALQPEQLADLIDVDSIPALLSELGRRLYTAPPPPAAERPAAAAHAATVHQLVAPAPAFDDAVDVDPQLLDDDPRDVVVDPAGDDAGAPYAADPDPAADPWAQPRRVSF